MKGQQEAEGLSEESNIGQLQRRHWKQNNKQKIRTTNRTNRATNRTVKYRANDITKRNNKAFNMARKIWVNSKFLDVCEDLVFSL